MYLFIYLFCLNTSCNLFKSNKLKQMNNYLKDYICLFIAFKFKKKNYFNIAAPKLTEMLH